MEGAAAGTVAHQRIDDLCSQRFDQFAYTSGGGALPTVDGQKGLGHGDGDLTGFETHDNSIATDDMEIVPLLVATVFGRGRSRWMAKGGGAGLGYLCGLHACS